MILFKYRLTSVGMILLYIFQIINILSIVVIDGNLLNKHQIQNVPEFFDVRHGLPCLVSLEVDLCDGF